MHVGQVSEKKQRELADQMRRLGVRPSDLDEWFVRAGKPGGQRANKVATCVVLRHRPSGIEVRCERERSQVLNRFLARRVLLGRLEAQRVGRLSEEARRIAKLRRQKRRRSRRTQVKLLQLKRLRTQKKALRRGVQGGELE